MFKKIINWFKNRKKWFKITSLTLIVLLIALRIALPSIVKHYINKTLGNDLEGYTGYVEDVDIAIYRGAYAVNGLYLFSTDTGEEEPFVEIKSIDISVLWKAIFEGALVSEIILEEPKVNFTYTQQEGEVVNNFDDADPVDWRDAVMDFIPLKISFIKINNGSVHYIDKVLEPNLDLYVSTIDFQINNLTNSKDLSENLISDFVLTANVMGQGRLKLDGELDPYDPDITLDLNTELSPVPVAEFNDFLNYYGWVDAEEGEIEVYSEVAIESGEMKGYMKPLIKGLELVSIRKDGKRPLNLVWQTLVGGIGELFENLAKDQIGTKIPLEGNVNSPDINIWKTIGGLFKNMFIEAIKPGLSQEISLNEDGEIVDKKGKKPKQKDGIFDKEGDGLFK